MFATLKKALFISLFSLCFALLLPVQALAQTTQMQTTQAEAALLPELDNNIPLNQHTFMQGIFFEIFSAIGCQLSGINIVNINNPCLAPNPQTGKLTYAPPIDNEGNIQIGGILGVTAKGIGMMYTPTTNSVDYFHTVASNFGIVKTAQAAPIDGFQGLQPLLPLWKAVRNFAYLFLIIAFIFIGIGVMLRLKIDPRTVMTIQNKIPDVIVCILLITFSYAIPALLIDTMWAVTYTGMNILTNVENPTNNCSTQNNLSKRATGNILNNPISFVNQIFVQCDQVPSSGIISLSNTVGEHISTLERDLILNFLNINPNDSCDLDLGGSDLFRFATAIPTFGLSLWGSDLPDIGKCVFTLTAVPFYTWLGSILWQLIILVALFITLFRIWFGLLIAYAMVLVYVVLGPIWIVFGLLPKKPLGFANWLKTLLINLGVFPLTVIIIMFAYIVNVKWSENPQQVFAPPLIGNPNVDNFGSILALAILLLGPQIKSILQEKLNAQSLKQMSAVGAGIGAGAAVLAPIAKKGAAQLNKKDQYGNATGIVSTAVDRTKHKVTNKFINSKLPGSEWMRKKQVRARSAKTSMGNQYATTAPAYNAAYQRAQAVGGQYLAGFIRRFGNDPTNPLYLDRFLSAQGNPTRGTRHYSNAQFLRDLNQQPLPQQPGQQQAQRQAGQAGQPPQQQGGGQPVQPQPGQQQWQPQGGGQPLLVQNIQFAGGNLQFNPNTITQNVGDFVRGHIRQGVAQPPHIPFENMPMNTLNQQAINSLATFLQNLGDQGDLG